MTRKKNVCVFFFLIFIFVISFDTTYTTRFAIKLPPSDRVFFSLILCFHPLLSCRYLDDGGSGRYIYIIYIYENKEEQSIYLVSYVVLFFGV